MTNPYDRPTYVRETYYDGNLPPDAGLPPEDDDRDIVQPSRHKACPQMPDESELDGVDHDHE